MQKPGLDSDTAVLNGEQKTDNAKSHQQRKKQKEPQQHRCKQTYTEVTANNLACVSLPGYWS